MAMVQLAENLVVNKDNVSAVYNAGPVVRVYVTGHGGQAFILGEDDPDFETIVGILKGHAYYNVWKARRDVENTPQDAPLVNVQDKLNAAYTGRVFRN